VPAPPGANIGFCRLLGRLDPDDITVALLLVVIEKMFHLADVSTTAVAAGLLAQPAVSGPVVAIPGAPAPVAPFTIVEARPELQLPRLLVPTLDAVVDFHFAVQQHQRAHPLSAFPPLTVLIDPRIVQYVAAAFPGTATTDANVITQLRGA